MTFQEASEAPSVSSTLKSSVATGDDYKPKTCLVTAELKKHIDSLLQFSLLQSDASSYATEDALKSLLKEQTA